MRRDAIAVGEPHGILRRHHNERRRQRVGGHGRRLVDDGHGGCLRFHRPAARGVDDVDVLLLEQLDTVVVAAGGGDSGRADLEESLRLRLAGLGTCDGDAPGLASTIGTPRMN